MKTSDILQTAQSLALEAYTSIKAQMHPHSKLLILSACFFLGFLGVHRMLLRQRLWWLQMLTLGGAFVWSTYDLYNISREHITHADGQPLVCRSIYDTPTI